MKKMGVPAILLCVAVFLNLFAPVYAAKHALVIGNGGYTGGLALPTPVNDANAIASTLRRLGFSVLKKTDLGHQAMEEVIRQFGNRLDPGDTGLFYFSGHGLQAKGLNYLIPVRSGIRSKSDIKFKSVAAEMVLAEMENSGSRVNIIILDACRNNPFNGFKSMGKGLIPMIGPKGTFIAYATAPGTRAWTGLGDESVYTKYLVQAMNMPGLKIEDVFKKVRAGVISETSGRQVPWDSSSLTGDFYLGGGSVITDKPERESPRTGSMLVETQPSGAMVYVDGVGKGESPMELNGLPPGSVTVQSVLSGYGTEEKRVSVEAGRIKRVTLIMDRMATRNPEPSPQVSAGGDFTNSIGMRFVYIQPGSFMIGSPEDEPGYDNDEKRHRVKISSGFHMQTTEVTQGQWNAVMGNNPSDFKNCGNDCPVEKVSWDDVQKFIRKLNRKEGGDKYRLPTEAEWEYAARAGSDAAYCFGDNESELSQYAWYDANSENSTHPTGRLKANAWGLYDIHGNVWEWCRDWYGEYPSETVTDLGGPTGSKRVLRGGSWGSNAGVCRVSNRGRSFPVNRNWCFGFRLIRLSGQ